MCCITSEECRQREFCRSAVPIFNECGGKLRRGLRGGVLKDFVHKLKVSMKELSETRIWLKLIGESGYVEKTKLADLLSESKELSRILSASVITTKKKIGG